MNKRMLGNVALFMTALIWGLGFVSQRAGMEHVGPFTFNMLRGILGSLSLLPLILWFKLSKPDTRTRRRKKFQRINLAQAGLGCGLALFTAMSIQQYCMQYVGAGKGGFITALYVVFVPIISYCFGSKINKNVIISVMLSVIGLYLLCFKAQIGFDIYDFMLLVGAFFYGVHIIVVDYYTERINAVKASCLQFLVLGILSALLVWMFETPTWETIVACKIPILYSGVLTSGVAYTLQIYGQKYTRPVVASLILCLESVFAVIGGMLILHEALTPKETLGCVFMITAVVLANIRCEKET